MFGCGEERAGAVGGGGGGLRSERASVHLEYLRHGLRSSGYMMIGRRVVTTLLRYGWPTCKRCDERERTIHGSVTDCFLLDSF